MTAIIVTVQIDGGEPVMLHAAHVAAIKTACIELMQDIAEKLENDPLGQFQNPDAARNQLASLIYVIGLLSRA